MKLVLADRDAYYLSHLIQKFVEELGNTLELQVITNPDFALHYFEREQSVDVILVSEEWLNLYRRRQEKCLLFILAEDEVKASEELAVYKYMSVQQIYSEVLQGIQKQAIQIQKKLSLPKKITFYAHRNYPERSELAVQIAEKLEKTGVRVLLINATYLQQKRANQEETEITANEIMAADSFTYKAFRPYIRRNAYDYLPRIKEGFLSCQLSLDAYIDFSEEAIKSGNYDLVISEIESGLTKECIRYFSASDRVIMISHTEAQEKEEIMRIFSLLGDYSSEKYIPVTVENSQDLARQSTLLLNLLLES